MLLLWDPWNGTSDNQKAAEVGNEYPPDPCLLGKTGKKSEWAEALVLRVQLVPLIHSLDALMIISLYPSPLQKRSSFDQPS
jgi:hypothetical protein